MRFILRVTFREGTVFQILRLANVVSHRIET